MLRIVNHEYSILSGIENYEKKIYDQKQLIEISKALNSELKLNAIIDSVLDTCLAHGGTFHIGIFLKLSVSSSKMGLAKHVGFDIPDESSFIISDESPFLKFLLDEPKVYTLEELYLKSAESDRPFKRTLNMLRKLNSKLLVISLITKKKIVGVLVLGPKNNHEEYSSSEKDFLLNISSIVAIAIENAWLYHMATVDFMTGLKLHHCFQAELRENIQIAIKEKTPLSIIMSDIDNFKKFNDTYGHQTGDKVLSLVASTLLKATQEKYTGYRYGGEEFIMILPQVNLIDAKKVAKNICEAVGTQMISFDNCLGANVTVSIGIAEFDCEIDKEPSIFIDRCDKALYFAKMTGKNKVSCA